MGAGASVSSANQISNQISHTLSTQILPTLSTVGAGIGAVSLGIASASHLALTQAVRKSISLAKRYASTQHPWSAHDFRESDLFKVPQPHLAIVCLLAELSSLVYLGPSEWRAAPTTNPTVNTVKQMPHAIAHLSMPLRFKLGDLYQRDLLKVPSGYNLKPIQDPHVMNQSSTRTAATTDRLCIVNGVFRSSSGRLSGMLMELEPKDVAATSHQSLTTRSLVLVFCGSQALSDTFNNSQCMFGSDPTNGAGQVHSGFAAAYNEIRIAFMHQIRTLFLDDQTGTHGVRKLYIGGHSLGGVFATFVAKDMCTNMPMALDELVVCTFGTPKIGDQTFQHEFNASVRGRGNQTHCYRFVHGNDVVPSIPPAFSGYVHVGQEIYLDEDGMWWKQNGGGGVESNGGDSHGGNERNDSVGGGNNNNGIRFEQDILMGEIVTSDIDEDPLEPFAAPRATVVVDPTTITTTSSASSSSSSSIVVQGTRTSDRLERFVDAMKAKPIDDHRVLCYVEHVTLLLLHQEISEKRLNALYETARGWVVEEEQEKDTDRSRLQTKLELLWQDELIMEQNNNQRTALGAVTVEALTSFFINERNAKGINNVWRFGDALLCGWKCWYDSNKTRRATTRRFIIRNEMFLSHTHMTNEICAWKDALPLLIAMQEKERRGGETKETATAVSGGGGGGGGDSDSDTRDVVKSTREAELLKQMKGMGFARVFDGLGRQELLLWDLLMDSQ